MIGELSKYQKITGVTTSDSAKLVISHNLGVIPKIIIVYPEDANFGDNDLAYGVFNQIVGSMKTYTDPSVAGSNGGVYKRYDEAAASAQRVFILSTTQAEIRKASSTYTISTTGKYTAEIYA